MTALPNEEKDSITGEKREVSSPPPQAKRNKTDQNGQFNLSHAMAASFRPGKLTRIEILTRLFPLQKRDVLELVLQGCNGDAMKAIEHFLSADESSHCDDANIYKAEAKTKDIEHSTEVINKKRNKNVSETKIASENLKNLETTPTTKPLNLKWDYPARTDIFTRNWGSFPFGAGSTILPSTPTVPTYPNTFLTENSTEPLLSCFPGRPNFVHPPSIPPFYYSSVPLRTPSYK